MRNHFNKKNICPNLEENISQEECLVLLESGKLNKKEKIVHTCEYCNKNFDRKSRLQNHINKCTEKQNKLDNLQTQIKNHEGRIIEQAKELQKLKYEKTKIRFKEENQFIYIVQEREFIKTGEEIYKIGKTINPKNRLSSYPKASVVYNLTKFKDCHDTEKELLKLFETKFVKRTDIGKEYFEGDTDMMIDVIIKYKFEEKNVFKD